MNAEKFPQPQFSRSSLEIGNTELPVNPSLESSDQTSKSVESSESQAEIASAQMEREATLEKKRQTERDLKLAEIKTSLGLEVGGNVTTGKKLELRIKPKEEWGQEKPISREDPLSRLQTWAKSFSKEERERRKTNEEIERQFTEDNKKYRRVNFDYRKGAGVEGMVGGDVGVLATGFFECSGLVLQTKDGVAVVHISPNAIREPSEGGEIVEDRNINNHIASAMRVLMDGDGKVARTKVGEGLTKEEIDKLQKAIDSGDLRSTLLAGEDKYSLETADMLSASAVQNNLPATKTEVYYVGNVGGGGGYSLYATPENIYVIGANNNLMKKGVNFPPTIATYEESQV